MREKSDVQAQLLQKFKDAGWANGAKMIIIDGRGMAYNVDWTSVGISHMRQLYAALKPLGFFPRPKLRARRTAVFV
jgi:hypothetical protein